MMSYNTLIEQRREKNKDERGELLPTSFTYEVSNKNNSNVELLDQVDWYSIKDTKKNKVYCDSKQFLFQDKYKHVFILSKRGIGKTYSLYEYFINTVVDFIEQDLEFAIENNNKQDVQLPLMVGFILQNGFYQSPLINTLNELIRKRKLGEYINLEVVTYIYGKIAVEVIIDFGSVLMFKKHYVFGEYFLLTAPNLARQRQFSEFNYIVFDEFEKAFAKSLLDENKVSVDVDQLFNNFTDLLNSFQRNENLRYLYLGNITNLNSIIWDFLKIANFDFKVQVNEHDDSDDKILILNLIPLFTNQSMANYFQDLTTLGISEEELFKMEGIINEENVIESLSSDSFVLFDDNYIYYFNGDICNIEKVDMNSMQKLNDVINKEFKTTTKVYKSDYELMDEWLSAHNYDHNQFTESLVPLQDLLEEQVIEHTAKIPVYSIGKISLDNTIVVDDVHSLLRGFKKSRYKFKSHREYFIYAKLI